MVWFHPIYHCIALSFSLESCRLTLLVKGEQEIREWHAFVQLCTLCYLMLHLTALVVWWPLMMPVNQRSHCQRVPVLRKCGHVEMCVTGFGMLRERVMTANLEKLGRLHHRGFTECLLKWINCIPKETPESNVISYFTHSYSSSIYLVEYLGWRFIWIGIQRLYHPGASSYNNHLHIIHYL